MVCMKNPKALLAALTLFAAFPAIAQDADNTAKNKRDQSGATKTPFDQSNAPEDIKLVATIRQLVVKDDGLSATAKNCKIITSGGEVILRGPVNTAAEKSIIDAHAAAAAGKPEKVQSFLEVKAAK